MTTTPSHCPRCGERIGPTECDHCGERCIEPGDRFCRSCGGAHPGIDPVTLECVEDAPESERTAPKAKPTKTIAPKLTLDQIKWIKAEARRSKMRPSRYLTALIGEYQGGDVVGAELRGSAAQKMHAEIDLDVHAWLKGASSAAQASMAHVVRWMIDREMGGGA